MTRKMLTAAIAVVALLFSVLALNADATPKDGFRASNRVCTYNDATGLGQVCADPTDYPGPFTNHPHPPLAPYGFSGIGPHAAVAADAGSGDGGGGTGGGLAHTGSESTVLGYVGTGLIAFGAVAMGSRRKFFQGALD